MDDEPTAIFLAVWEDGSTDVKDDVQEGIDLLVEHPGALRLFAVNGFEISLESDDESADAQE